MLKKVYQRLALAGNALLYGDTPREKGSESIQIRVEDLTDIKRFFPMEKFFIFGHARSGTTLLARLVRVHPTIHCNWQAHFFTRPPFLSSLVSNPDFQEWLSRRDNRWNQGADLSPVVMRTVSDFILEREAKQLGKTIVGDKSPNNLINGEAVHKLADIYPDAKLIFIVRDGRDAVLSHQIQKFVDLSDQLNFEDSAIRDSLIDSPREFRLGKRSIFTKHGLSAAARDWVSNVSETHQHGRDIFADNYMAIRFEDLVSNPPSSLEKIWSFLGVDIDLPDLTSRLEHELSQNPDADWQQAKQKEVASIIRKGLPGSWREIFTKEDRKMFKDIAGETLIEWGYENDLNW